MKVSGKSEYTSVARYVVGLALENRRLVNKISNMLFVSRICVASFGCDTYLRIYNQDVKCIFNYLVI